MCCFSVIQMCSFKSKMGLLFSSVQTLFSGEKQIRVIMVGMSGSGKTTILYKLKLGEVVLPIPTVDFNVETIKHKDTFFTIWDIGGGCKIAPLWHHYYGNSGKAVILVIDSTDKMCIDEVGDYLNDLLSYDELRDAVLLVYANKQDYSNTLSASEIAEKLHLYQLGNRKWYVQVASAVEGKGLYEGLDWLSSVLKTLHKSD